MSNYYPPVSGGSYQQQPQPAAAGWYPDPGGAGNEYGPAMRWWDGAAWTSTIEYATFENQTFTKRVGPGGLPYAEWWQRGLGYLIDGLIFIPIMLPIAIIMLGTVFSSVLPQVSADGELIQPDAQSMLLSILPWVILMNVLIAAYDIIMIATLGRTVGGIAMGIKAITRDGGLPGWGRSFKRYGVIFAFTTMPGFFAFIPYVGETLSNIGAPLALLCFLSMFFNANRQAWQDLAAGTYVVKVR